MIIACLGWGSLIWDPRTLPIRQPWYEDGPFLPIEFTRRSKDDRITLVITPKTNPVRVLWALMSIVDINQAKIELAEREGIEKENIGDYIGVYTKDIDVQDENFHTIALWATQKQIDGVIWTNLPPRWGGNDNVIPTREEVINHLNSLLYARQKHAEEYIRKSPQQIDTEYRRAIEILLGWKIIK